MNRAPEEDRIVPSARAVAAHVLERVIDKAAYASRALDAELSRAHLDPRDAALATEIVYGTLRVLPALDRAITAQLTRANTKIDGFAHAALRSASYQLAHLGRLPTHAIVDESVALVRARRGAKLGGFVNAVLRKLASARPEAPEPPKMLVLPTFMMEQLEHGLGAERLARFIAPFQMPPPIGLRVEREERDALLASLQSALPNAELALSAVSKLGLVARRAGDLRALPGYARGELTLQEEGAQLVALGLDAQPGERIADVCAGHGGKTTLFARAVGPSGHVRAIDRDERKLLAIPAEQRRLQLPSDSIALAPIDLAVGLGGLGDDFDRVMVDAPCTGLGTVHRRPELLLRLTAADAERMGSVQTGILARAAGLVRPGGVLGYAVCSPTEAEGRAVADRFEASQPTFERLHEALSPQGPKPDADGIARIGPWLVPERSPSCPDAYQLVLWRRRA
ncbi:MAG TPA: transcription antitermination factor NusB [Polyangiales bacterium]|nr:transcription antitermination factor NusB [Polyangiales bacterium]